MKFLFLICGLLLSPTAFAQLNTYELKIDVAIDGKKVATPKIILKEGEKGTINSKSESTETNIEVVTTKEKNNHLLMKFKVALVGENGQRKIIGEPVIITSEKEPANIEVSQSPNQTSKLSLTVTAQKITL